ncbi:hypothetical protein BH10BAC4_BH10BAC4_02840 [soil metagenome]
MGYVSNINVRHRLTQIVVFIVLVLASMLYAEVTNAQGASTIDKPKYRIQVHKDSNRTCYILHKKRTARPKQPLFASSRRSSKSKAMAETDDTRATASN